MDLRAEAEDTDGESASSVPVGEAVDTDGSAEEDQYEQMEKELQRLRSENEILRGKIKRFEKAFSMIQHAMADVPLDE